jgi:hypothetical protein
MSLNNILKKIAQSEKTELAKHNIELGLVDTTKGLQKMVKERISFFDKLISEINKVEDLKSNLITQAKNTYSVFEMNNKELNILTKQITDNEVALSKVAKELNLNVREIPEFKELLDLKEKMVSTYKEKLFDKNKILKDITTIK